MIRVCIPLLCTRSTRTCETAVAEKAHKAMHPALLLALLIAHAVDAAWIEPLRLPNGRRAARPPAPTRARSASACICINCRFVDRCTTYHWVETQHEQPHVTSGPDFEPSDPQSADGRRATHPRPRTEDTDRPIPFPDTPAVQVFIRSEAAAAAAAAAPGAPDAGSEEPEASKAQSLLTTEYDVYRCDSFAEEKGKWLRLMPALGYVPT